MPLYEYQCKKCGKIMEVLSKTADAESELDCPSCGKEKQFTKIFSTFAAHGAAASDSLPVQSMSKSSGGGCCGGSCGCGH